MIAKVNTLSTARETVPTAHLRFVVRQRTGGLPNHQDQPRSSMGLIGGAETGPS